MRIKSLAQLEQAANNRKSVMISSWGIRPHPAAFIYSMQGREIARFIRGGMFIYKPKFVRKPRKPHYSESETLQILAQMSAEPVCSCGQKPVQMMSSWNWIYLVCLNPDCARKVSVSGFYQAQPDVAFMPRKTAFQKFKIESQRKLLTYDITPNN